MPFSRLLDILEGVEKANGVFYASHQCSSFTEEYQQLKEDVPSGLMEWGSEVFGVSPDAVNFWLGGGSSVSSTHKDHYENLYAVVVGCKHFTLLPPWDRHLLYE
eukprot:RCo010509